MTSDPAAGTACGGVHVLFRTHVRTLHYRAEMQRHAPAWILGPCGFSVLRPCGCDRARIRCVSCLGPAMNTNEARRPFLTIALISCLGLAFQDADVSAAPKPVAQEDGQWSMPSKDYAATRYSTLSQITRANAAGLHPVWTFSTGVLGGHEGQPLVVNDTMYVVTPWPNVLYAFDLTKEGYPLRWKYRPTVDPNALGIACCDSVNRGAF